MNETTAQADPQQSPVIHTFSATGPIEVSVQNLRGRVRLIAEPGDAVRVELSPRGEAGRELVERMRVRFEDGRLSVDAPAEEAHHLGGRIGEFFRGLGTDSSDDAAPSWADRLADGVRSTVRSLEGLAGELRIAVVVPSGSGATVHDGSGDVSVRGDLARLEVRTGVGTLEVERSAQGSTRLTTGSGDIDVGEARGSLIATTGTGDVALGQVDGDVRVTTGTGRIAVRRALAGALRIKSGLGDVTVHVARGTAAKVDLATGVGERDVQLSPVDGAGGAERILEIEGRCAKGDLRVLRAER